MNASTNVVRSMIEFVYQGHPDRPKKSFVSYNKIMLIKGLRQDQLQIEVDGPNAEGKWKGQVNNVSNVNEARRIFHVPFVFESENEAQSAMVDLLTRIRQAALIDTGHV